MNNKLEKPRQRITVYEGTSIKRFSLPWGGSEIMRNNSEYDVPRFLTRIGTCRWTTYINSIIQLLIKEVHWGKRFRYTQPPAAHNKQTLHVQIIKVISYTWRNTCLTALGARPYMSNTSCRRPGFCKNKSQNHHKQNPPIWMRILTDILWVSNANKQKSKCRPWYIEQRRVTFGVALEIKIQLECSVRLVGLLL